MEKWKKYKLGEVIEIQNGFDRDRNKIYEDLKIQLNWMSSFLLKKPDIFLQDNYLSNDFIITDKKQNKKFPERYEKHKLSLFLRLLYEWPVKRPAKEVIFYLLCR